MAITQINVGTSANDGTGDPLRTAFQKTNTNLLNITADGGNEITVVDPTTATDAPLNTALQNIFDSGGGGVPTLPQVLAEGGRTILKIDDADETYTTVLADKGKIIYIPSSATVFTEINIDNLYTVGDTILIYSQSDGISIKTIAGSAFLPNYTTELLTSQGSLISISLIEIDGSSYSYSYNIMPYEITSGGVTDGDKGDITVSGSGTVWTIDNGMNATKIADGSVSNAEFQRLDGVSSNIQTQLDHRVITLLNDNVDSSAVTGTVANSILKSYLIPANTLAVGDTLDFKSVCSKTNGGTPANSNFRLYTNTSNSLTGASSLALVTPASTNLYFSLDRTYTLKSGNTLESFPVGSSAVTDEAPNNTAISNTAFNPAVDNYFLIAIQPNSSGDSFKQTLCYISQMKAKTTI